MRLDDLSIRTPQNEPPGTCSGHVGKPDRAPARAHAASSCRELIDLPAQAFLTKARLGWIIRHRHRLRQARAPAGFASVDVAACDRAAALRAGVGDGLGIGFLLVQSRGIPDLDRFQTGEEGFLIAPAGASRYT